MRPQEKSKPNLLADRQDDKKEVSLSAPIHQSQILPQSIKQRHIESNNYLVTFGLSADLPDGGSFTKCYFAYDNNKLYIFNTDTQSWVSTTLS